MYLQNILANLIEPNERCLWLRQTHKNQFKAKNHQEFKVNQSPFHHHRQMFTARPEKACQSQKFLSQKAQKILLSKLKNWERDLPGRSSAR